MALTFDLLRGKRPLPDPQPHGPHPQPGSAHDASGVGRTTYSLVAGGGLVLAGVVDGEEQKFGSAFPPERLRAHPAREVTLPWRELGGEPRTARLVFVTRQGGPFIRRYYNHHIWKPALRKADVPATRENGMHALRHYYASVLLEGGVSIRALADYLGHRDPGFTLRTYTHLMPESADQTRRVVDNAFGRRSRADQPGTKGKSPREFGLLRGL